MSNIEEIIKRLSEQMARDQEMIDLIIDKQDLIEACPFKIIFAGRSSRVIINNLGQLHDARTFMEKVFGYKDYNYVQAFYSSCAIATFESEKGPWAIWLECSIDDFPKELMPSDNCKWLERADTSYSLVCGRE